MSVPAIVRHTGVLTSTSTSQTNWASSGPFDTTFTATYAAQKQSQEDVLNATEEAPLVIPLENVAKVRVLVCTATGNSVTVLTTTAAGVDQAETLSGGGIIIKHIPVLGDEITAIKVVGTNATFSYFIAGDHA